MVHNKYKLCYISQQIFAAGYSKWTARMDIWVMTVRPECTISKPRNRLFLVILSLSCIKSCDYSGELPIFGVFVKLLPHLFKILPDQWVCSRSAWQHRSCLRSCRQNRKTLVELSCYYGKIWNCIIFFFFTIPQKFYLIYSMFNNSYKLGAQQEKDAGLESRVHHKGAKVWTQSVRGSLSHQQQFALSDQRSLVNGAAAVVREYSRRSVHLCMWACGCM